MKKLISLTFAVLAMGTMFIAAPAQADDDENSYGSEAERFCAEYGDLTNEGDIIASLQDFIGEIENMKIDDLLDLTEIGEDVEDGEDLSDICDDID